MFNQVARRIACQLAQAGIHASVSTDRFGSVFVDAECDTLARDVLGFERFTGYIGDVEVTII